MVSYLNTAFFKQFLRLTIVMAMTVSCAGWAFASEVPDARVNLRESLIVESLIETAISQHPSVRAEYSQGRASLEDYEAAQMRRYPNLSLQTESTTADTASGAARTLTIDQILWSAGRDGALVDSAKAATQVHGAQLLETKYHVSLRVIDAWQGLLQSRARIQEIMLTQRKLDELFALMQRRVAAGASANIEMELIATRVAQARVDLQQANAMSMTSKSKLEVLLGKKFSMAQLVGTLSLSDQVQIVSALAELNPSDRMLDSVETHPTVNKARYQAQAAQFDLKAQQAALWPQLYARYQKTISGGSMTYADGLYIGLKYQPGAGFSSLAQAKSAQARAEGAMQSIDVAQRDLRDAIQADIEELSAAQGRADALANAVVATALLQESYERQFVVGRRNWQEVMNSMRENNDVRLSLVDARANIIGATYRLRTRMGGLTWQQGTPEQATQ